MRVLFNWIQEDKDKQHEEDEQHEEGNKTAQYVPGETKTPTKAVRGKYTVHNNGTTKYSGWSDAGMAYFDELYLNKFVNKANRKCPEVAAMEKEFLEYAIYYAHNSKQRSKANNAGTAIGESANMQRWVVQVDWESDDE